MTPLLANSVRYAQRTVAALMIGLTLLCFAQSYRQLIDFATLHGEPRPWNWAWPAMLDGFTLLGELLLFVAVVQRWKRHTLILGAALAAAGFAASLAANVGYLPRADAPSRITSAAAPTGAAVALFAALLLLEFQVRDVMHAAAEEKLAAAAQRAEDRAAQRAAAELQRAEAQRAAAEAQHAAALQRAPAPLSLVRGAAPFRPLHEDGPEVQRAREECSAALAAGRPLPSARGIAARHLGGDGRTGGNARLAKRVLEEFGGDHDAVVADAAGTD